LGLLVVIMFNSCAETAPKNDAPITSDIIEAPVFDFFVAGHAYGKPTINNKGFHPPFQKYMDTHHSEYKSGFFAGDFILSATPENWDQVDSVTENWLPELNFVAGNHDVGDRSLFEERHDVTNRFFVKDHNLFVILDLNSTGWNIWDNQWAMIESAIKNNPETFENIFVMTHQLFFYNDGPTFKNIVPNSKSGKAPNLDFFSKYYKKITDSPSNFYFFCGDVGIHARNCNPGGYSFENMKIIYTGMGSGINDHFISATIKEDSVHLQINYLSPSKVETIDESFYEHIAK